MRVFNLWHLHPFRSWWWCQQISSIPLYLSLKELGLEMLSETTLIGYLLRCELPESLEQLEAHMNCCQWSCTNQVMKANSKKLTQLKMWGKSMKSERKRGKPHCVTLCFKASVQITRDPQNNATSSGSLNFMRSCWRKWLNRKREESTSPATTHTLCHLVIPQWTKEWMNKAPGLACMLFGSKSFQALRF